MDEPEAAGIPLGLLPLHRQLEEWLRQQIKSGVWAPGAALPTEFELAARFGVSRAPIRQALTSLVNAGLIYRRAGRGTFVAPPKIGQALDTLRGVAEELRVQGLQPEVELLGVTRVEAPPEVRGVLGADGEVPRIERLVRVGGEPLLWDRSYLTPAVNLPPAGDHALFALVESSGFAIEEAEQTIEAAGAEREAAQHLDLHVGDPVLVMNRITRARRGQPVIFTIAVYRGDRYRYRVALQREVLT